MTAPDPGKPVVLIAEELSPATVEALGPDFEIRTCNGADRAELLPAIADVDAILVRSATKVDAEALAAARRLNVVARAGVGLDNVDVKAATQSGVMVVNAPTSNIVSAAELAVGLMLATSGRRYMETAPYLAIIPGLFISITVLSFNMLGDTIRDVLDPRLRGSR